MAIVVVFTICLVWQQRVWDRLFLWLVGLTAVYLFVHILLWWLNSNIYQESALLGIVYNTRLPAFLVLGYGAMRLYPGKFAFSSIVKLILVVSTIVAGLGVVQYFLPSDILTHLGYGLERGTRPAFFIEDNPDLPRIMSTLREPNALGAYLILPAAALLTLLFKEQKPRVRYMFAIALLLHLVAIFLTFSRSAWLGVALALTLVVWWQIGRTILQWLRRFWPLVVGFAIVVLGLAFAMRNTEFFQRYIVHSEPTEQIADLDSNDLHLLLTKQGLEGIADKPLGHGPGTAGLVSIRNPNGGLLTENYYIQIGYEVGVIGLAIFIALNVFVYIR
ncbi:O-antigen ligase family protein, partial [Candidatus Saccharibacteria bacterium]|nr:O-antigen ligase family protein [Candidatus Saccharibacteria bacterium]